MKPQYPSFQDAIACCSIHQNKPSSPPPPPKSSYSFRINFKPFKSYWPLGVPTGFAFNKTGHVLNSEVCHPRCVGTITQEFCVLHVQSNTTIFKIKLMMTSYHLRISCCVCGATSSCFNMPIKIVLVSVTGMLEYRFVMSKEAREWCGSSSCVRL